MTKNSNLFTVYWQMRMAGAERRLGAALELISHKPTRGTLGEDVVREIIDAFLPGQWKSGSGFIVDTKQQPSHQLDIIIYDQLKQAPLYRDENVVVLPTGTRPIVVEVKSELKKDTLFDALENIASPKAQEETGRNVIGVVYAFRGFAKPQTFSTHLSTHLKALRRKGRFDPAHLPDMICVQEQNMIVVRDLDPKFKMTAYSSRAPVVQSLLTQVLNGLGVSSLYPLLPKPKYARSPLFTLS
jgi:hypothetical protein